MASAGLPSPAQGKRILVVDDEAYNVEILRIIITSMGIDEKKVVGCLSAKEGLSHLMRSLEASPSQESEFAVIFTDLSMPIMDGYRFTSRVRKLFKQARVA